MKVIIAGSRTITSRVPVDEAIKRSGFEITEVISGCASGVDRLGEGWAADHDTPIKRFPADWNQHGKRAGYLRNAEMARYADGLIAIWDGKSHGTSSMIDLAGGHGLKIHVLLVTAGAE